MLEFTYKWKTSSGVTNDTLFIPVPEGKRDEAYQLVLTIRTVNNIKDPSESDPRYALAEKTLETFTLHKRLSLKLTIH
jgi:hypothetical protein